MHQLRSSAGQAQDKEGGDAAGGGSSNGGAQVSFTLMPHGALGSIERREQTRHIFAKMGAARRRDARAAKSTSFSVLNA